jgi:hypothetical protein
MNPLHAMNDTELEVALHQAVALRDAPAAWVHAAVGLWKAPAQGRLGTALRRIQAVLTFDSLGAMPLAAGMRSLGSPSRQLLFSADGLDIDLRIRPDGAAFALSGQVLGNLGAGRVALAPEGAPDAPSHAASLDDLGEFRLPGVPPGRYLLSLQSDEQLVCLPAIDLAPAGS